MSFPLIVVIQCAILHNLVKGLLVKRLVGEETIVDLDELITHLPNPMSDLGIDATLV